MSGIPKIIGSRVLPIDLITDSQFGTYYIPQVKYDNGMWYGIAREKSTEGYLWSDLSFQKKYCACLDEQKAYRILEDFLEEEGE